ncbi:hypothetical protein B0H21DRAFT_889798 [Amylocystis lapponica]|nr:hypothetical protein B0H21DRAFT_889798 [Amylocystis lapponica]
MPYTHASVAEGSSVLVPGVPGLPRVIDALSTIMWPSIAQSDATPSQELRARTAQLGAGRGRGRQTCARSSSPSRPTPAPPRARQRRRAAYSARWRSWSADSDAAWGAGTTPIGFDDDSTEFVCAPSPRQPSAEMLLPMHTGASYRSLASLFDFGDASSDSD